MNRGRSPLWAPAKGQKEDCLYFWQGIVNNDYFINKFRMPLN